MSGLMIYIIDELEITLIACYYPCTHISFLVPRFVVRIAIIQVLRSQTTITCSQNLNNQRRVLSIK